MQREGCRRRVDQPVHLRRDQPVRQQVLPVADDHRARLRDDLQHEPLPARRDAQPLALADGEPLDAVVLAEDRAVLIDDGARPRRAPAGAGASRRRGRRRARSRSRRCPACPRRRRPASRATSRTSPCGQSADGEQQARQHLAADAVQDVGLVLVRVEAAVQLRPVRPADDPGVVAGGDEVGVELLAERPQLAELQPGVADDARVRRAAAEVLVGEVVDDAVELALEVERVERDVEPVGDAPGVAGVDGRAAALLVVRPARRPRRRARRSA